jgi:hypothetical protein
MPVTLGVRAMKHYKTWKAARGALATSSVEHDLFRKPIRIEGLMDQDEPLDFDKTIKLYEVLRDYVKHEDTVANLRLNWMLVAQPVFATALALTFSGDDKLPDLTNRIRIAIAIFAAMYALIFASSLFLMGKVFIDLDQKGAALRKRFPKPLELLLPNIRWGMQVPPPLAGFLFVPVFFTAMWIVVVALLFLYWP